MNIQNYNDAKKLLSDATEIDFDTSFSLAQLCSKLLRDTATENNGREIVIRIQDSWDRIDNKTHFLWNDLCESSGLYPYLESALLEGSSLLRYEFHSSRYLPDTYFHEEQNQVSLHLQSKNSIVLSAPTSFGKSLLIEELIASQIYHNIVVVQPTLALLDETRKKLLKYSDYYKIIVSTNQPPVNDSKNVFLFTPERVVEYEYFSNVDFFVIDEFYKLSLERQDDRGIILNQALNKLLGFTRQFYFLGPSVSSLPREFQDKYDFLWINSNFATVAVDEYPKIITSPKDKLHNELQLFDLLLSLNEPTMIYCSSQQRTMALTEGYIDYLEERNLIDHYLTSDNDDMAEWIRLNIHDKWILKSALQKSIAFHHGSLPRHLGSSIVDAFNNGTLNHLFCTSTLIEGVNTTAKNVVLFDKLKGQKRLDYFDYRNIAGRSGRMAQHFIGRVYNFHPQPEEEYLDIDIPIITQDNAPLELLIQIDESQLKPLSIDKLREFNQLNADLKYTIKKNPGLPVQGQLDMVTEIEQNLPALRYLLQWTGPSPSYDQLRAVLDLAWRHLRATTRAEHNISSSNQLTYYALKYAKIQSIKAFIQEDLRSQYWADREPDFDKRVNIIVFRMLDIARHWFDFKLPKLLNVVSTLQNYVFSKHNYPPGNYSLFANSLERGNFPPSVAMLLDYNVPSSAIVKIAKYVDPDATPEAVLAMLSEYDLTKFELIPYEISRINAITRYKTS